MKSMPFIYCVLLTLFTSQTAFAQFKIPDIQKAIKQQESALKNAIEKAKQDKRNEDAKLANEAKKREEKLKAKKEAVKKEQEQNQLRLKDLQERQDIQKLQEEAKRQSDLFAELSIQSERSISGLEEKAAILTAKVNELENNQNTSNIKMEKIESEKELQNALRMHAVESEREWFWGFMVSVISLVITGIGLWVDLRHKKAEIRILRHERQTSQQAVAQKIATGESKTQ